MHTQGQGLQPTQSIYFPKIVAWQELIQINSISVITLGGYHSYSLSLRGETEVFHFFFSFPGICRRTV